MLQIQKCAYEGCEKKTGAGVQCSMVGCDKKYHAACIIKCGVVNSDSLLRLCSEHKDLAGVIKDEK